MSNISNQQYIESMNEGFIDAVSTKDFQKAQRIVNDLHDLGFEKEAGLLQQELKETAGNEALLLEDIKNDSHG